MSVLNTLVLGFGDVAEAIFALQKKGVIKIVDAYYLSNDFKVKYEEVLLSSNNVDFSYDYHISCDMYKKVFDNFFSGFAANIGRFDSYTGNSTSYSETMFTFKRCINYAYNKILKKSIELILFPSVPHEGVDYVFYALARVLNIKTIMTYEHDIELNALFLFDDISELGNYKGREKIRASQNLEPSLFLKVRDEVRSSKAAKAHKASMDARLEILLNKDHIFYKSNRMKYEKFLKILKNVCINKIPHNLKYIYFPLHFQPEQATFIADNIWDDQAVLIEFLASKLPEDIYIVVKDQWLQSFCNRDWIFYQRLIELKRVIFINPEILSGKVLHNALAAATITGSIGWEALASGKPVIYSGYTPYKNMPGAFELNDNFDINKILNCRVNYDLLKGEFNKLLSTSYEGRINPSFSKIDHKKNINNLISAYSSYISIFLNNNSQYKGKLHDKFQKLRYTTMIQSTPLENCMIKGYEVIDEAIDSEDGQKMWAITKTATVVWKNIMRCVGK
ncbi:MAG: hypothetical protein LBG04_03950 [Holosporaceae bacterium]|jgi:hypothetical protein|nr:hypothetical protein [Holosporaceae bacterium]